MLLAHKVWESFKVEFSGKMEHWNASALARALSSKGCRVKKFHLIGPQDFETEIAGWSSIALAAIANETIEDFAIGGGQLPNYEEDIGKVVEKLSVNTTLRRFLVSMHEINGVLFTHEFDELFQSNHSLEYFFISGMHWEMSVTSVCTGALNRAGRKYMIEENNLEKGVECLARFAENHYPDNVNVNAIFMHLRENPHVFVPAAAKRSQQLRSSAKRKRTDDDTFASPHHPRNVKRRMIERSFSF